MNPFCYCSRIFSKYESRIKIEINSFIRMCSNLKPFSLIYAQSFSGPYGGYYLYLFRNRHDIRQRLKMFNHRLIFACFHRKLTEYSPRVFDTTEATAVVLLIIRPSRFVPVDRLLLNHISDLVGGYAEDKDSRFNLFGITSAPTELVLRCARACGVFTTSVALVSSRRRLLVSPRRSCNGNLY